MKIDKFKQEIFNIIWSNKLDFEYRKPWWTSFLSKTEDMMDDIK